METAGADEDRLSELPDCLLHDILSRLKARQAVQTCVLASRWRRLWLTAPCLTIDGGEFLSPRPGDDLIADVMRHYGRELVAPYQELRGEDLARFEDFVDNLLCRRGTAGLPLETLELLTGRGRWIERWVRRGLRCSPAALRISGDGCVVTLPPPSLTSGAALRLKKLSLDGVILSLDFEQHLSSGLPVLQDLEIRDSQVSHLTRIASPTLKNLTVYSADERDFSGGKMAFAVLAPRLASLSLGMRLSQLPSFGVTVEEAPCLVQASVRILDDDEPELLRQHGHGGPLCKFLRSLSHVTTLDLSGLPDKAAGGFHPEPMPYEEYPPHMPYYLQPPPYVYPPMPMQDQFYAQAQWHLFHQPPPMVPSDPRPMLEAILDNALPMLHGLKTLVLEDCHIGPSMQKLQGFLQTTPVLEKLTLKNCQCQQFSSFSMVIQRGTNGKFEDVLDRLGGMQRRYTSGGSGGNYETGAYFPRALRRKLMH